jgi:hypothetical protein
MCIGPSSPEDREDRTRATIGKGKKKSETPEFSDFFFSWQMTLQISIVRLTSGRSYRLNR